MTIDQQTQDQKAAVPAPNPEQDKSNSLADQIDGLKDKKPEDLSPEELRLMADTMPR